MQGCGDYRCSRWQQGFWKQKKHVTEVFWLMQMFTKNGLWPLHESRQRRTLLYGTFNHRQVVNSLADQRHSSQAEKAHERMLCRCLQLSCTENCRDMYYTGTADTWNLQKIFGHGHEHTVDSTHIDLAGGFWYWMFCDPTLNIFLLNILTPRRRIPWGSLEHVGTTSKPVWLAIRHLQIEKQQNSIEPTWPRKPSGFVEIGGISKIAFSYRKLMIKHDQQSIILGHPLSHKQTHLNTFKIN